MKKIHYIDSIISPNITEKSTSMSEFDKVVFKVNKKANKNSIKKSIEKIFKVNVIKINTINIKGKTKLVKNSHPLLKQSKKTGKEYYGYAIQCMAIHINQPQVLKHAILIQS